MSEAKVTSKTPLSVLREIVKQGRAPGDPRLARSIQQSLATEGYVYSEQAVQEVLDRSRANREA